MCLAWLSTALYVVACGTRAPADLDPEQSTAPNLAEAGSEFDADSDSAEADSRDQTDLNVDSDTDESPRSDTETGPDTAVSPDAGAADAGRTDTDT